MGINTVKSHMHGARHKTAVGHREQQLSITSFCAPPVTPLPNNTTAELANTATTATSASSSADIRVAMGSTPTLIWCLNTVVKHHSLNSNEGISDIFKSMFPDSDTVYKFSWFFNEEIFVFA